MRWLLPILSCLAGGCGGEVALGGPEAPDASHGGSPFDAGHPAASVLDAGMESGSRPAGDAGPGVESAGDAAVPSSVDRCVTLTMDPHEVAAGEESYMCQQFANPFGKDVDIVWADGTAYPAARFFAFSMDASVSATEPSPGLGNCVGSGLEFHPTAFMSQQQHRTVGYPESNMGYPVPGANRLMLDVHYLNTSTTASIPGTASVTLCSAKPGVVTTHVGTIYLYNAVFSVPPTPMSSPMSVSKAWTPSAGDVPSSYTIYSSWSFMTSRGLDIQASTGGNVFYDNPIAAAPPVYLHNPPVAMTGAQSIQWTCKIFNDTSSPLTFGDSVLSNAWCEYMAGYYPVADLQKPDVTFAGP